MKFAESPLLEKSVAEMRNLSVRARLRLSIYRALLHCTEVILSPSQADKNSKQKGKSGVCAYAHECACL